LLTALPSDEVTVSAVPLMVWPELSVSVAVNTAFAPVSNEELPVTVKVVPVTATTTFPDAEPDVTVTVIFRFDLLDPGINVAVATPVDEFVVAETLLRTPESDEKDTAVLVSELFEASFTRAVIVTPVELSAEFSVNADANTSTVAAELVVVPDEELLPTSPPPPHAANKAATIRHTQYLK